jgi:hypothetical protein
MIQSPGENVFARQFSKRLRLGNDDCVADGPMETSMTAKSKNASQVQQADKVIYLNFCKVMNEEGWGHTLEGVGSPLYIFQNSESGAQTAFYWSAQREVVAFHSPDADVLGRYIEESAQRQFHELTGKEVDFNYVRELIVGVMQADPTDFEYENKVKTLLLEGEENINDKTLKKVVNRYGVWVLVRDSMEIQFDEKNKSLLVDGVERYATFEETFDDLFGSAAQTALLIK